MQGRLLLLVLLLPWFVSCVVELEGASSGGIFGNWETDANALPCFEWTLNQRSDPRAFWPNSEDVFPIYKKRNDHFQVLLVCFFWLLFFSSPRALLSTKKKKKKND
jgi:hypothetical protein